jgi:hypothetical protein
MPRQSRIYSPGMLQRIITRSIERKKIFKDGVFGPFDLNFIKQIDVKSVQRFYS